jgi:hypothetical protein
VPWSGAPDSVRCTRGLQAKLCTFGNSQRCFAIIHRTVRCTTGQCPVPQRRATLNSPASGMRSAIIHRTCPVHTGLSGEPAEQRLLRANGRLQCIKCAPTRAEEQCTCRSHTGQSTGLCQGLVVSAPALVPHRLAKGAVGSLKGRVPLLPSAWLLGCEWWALLARPAHERMNARSCRVWAGPGVGR